MNSITKQTYLTLYNTYRNPLQRETYTLSDKFLYYGKKGAAALALVVATVALPILLIVDIVKSGTQSFLGLFRKKTTPITQPSTLAPSEFHFLYTSPIFDSYFSQLQNFIKNSLQNDYPEIKLMLNSNSQSAHSLFQNHSLELLKYIQNQTTIPDNPFSKREFHQKILDHLRSAIKNKPTQHNLSKLDLELVNCIETFCKWMYTDVHLKEDYLRFLTSEIESHSWKNTTWESIHHIYHNLKIKNKFTNTQPGSNDDIHRIGDIPAYLFDMHINNQKIKVIRTPNITRTLTPHPKNLSDIWVCEEFLAFLDIYQKENKQHLYFNLMARNEHSCSMGHQRELIRSKTIENLEQHEKYGKSFNVASFDKDSDFYWQKETTNSVQSEKFKSDFLNHLFSDFYYWPKKLNLIYWKIRCEEIINVIHQSKFNAKNAFTHQERLDFIEIVYTRLFRDLLTLLPSASCNFTCLGAIDRGASTVALQRTAESTHSITTLPETTNTILDTSAFAYVPSILSRGRLILPERFPRLQTALQALGV